MDHEQLKDDAKRSAEEIERERLEEQHGEVWDTAELRRDFEVEGFGAPCVVVRRKSDGQRGTLFFQHSPRFYFDFGEHHDG